MYDRRILEVTLTRVALENIPGSEKSGYRVLTACLVWPRPAIAGKTAVKTVCFENGKADLTDFPWTEQIVFKETVQGPFGLEVGLSDMLSNAEAEKFIAFLGSAAWKVVGGAAGDITGSAIGSGLVSAPFKYLSGLAKGIYKAEPRSFGTGALDLRADKTWKPGKIRRRKIELTAPSAIYRMRRQRQSGRLVSRRRKIMEKGKICGEVELGLRLYD
ncbi:MAG: hypothetical protein R6V03_10625 [Kiritimatiellia bacterium]